MADVHPKVYAAIDGDDTDSFQDQEAIQAWQEQADLFKEQIKAAGTDKRLMRELEDMHIQCLHKWALRVLEKEKKIHERCPPPAFTASTFESFLDEATQRTQTISEAYKALHFYSTRHDASESPTAAMYRHKSKVLGILAGRTLALKQDFVLKGDFEQARARWKQIRQEGWALDGGFEAKERLQSSPLSDPPTSLPLSLGLHCVLHLRIMTPHTSGTPFRHYSFSCGICGTRFVRREHLSRHIRSHTKEKPFQCRTCQKTFTRADILQRHERSHTFDGAVKTAKPGGSFRACLSCASGRVRCSGQDPCKTCDNKGVECKYPPASVPRSTSKQSVGRAMLDMAVATEAPGTPAGNGRLTGQLVPGAQNGGMLESDAMQGSPNLPIQESALPAQLAGDQERQWDTWPGSGNPYLSDFQQFADDNTQYPPQNGYQDESSFGNPDSINWMSPSTSVWRDWDFRFASLADPSVSVGFTPLLQAPIQVSLNVDQGAGHSRSMNTEPQMTFSPAGIATGNAASPGMQSTTHSVHSLQSEGASIGIVSGSNDRRRPSPRLYVDSVGARGTLQKPRRKRTRSLFELEASQDPRTNTSMYQQNNSPDSDESLPCNPWISPEISQAIVRNAKNLASEDPNEIESSHIPSLGLLNTFCQLYFDNFHPEFPFLDKTPIQLKDGGWVLAIAVATIGAQYSDLHGIADQRKILESTLSKALRTLLGTAKLDDASTASTWPRLPSAEKLVVIQAQILNILVTTRNIEALKTSKALEDFKSLVSYAKQANLLHPLPSSASESVYTAEIKLRARTGSMIFILDYIFSYEFSHPPLLDIADVQIPLYISLEISSGNITTERDELHPRSTLTDALDMLFTEKLFDPGLCEFDRILLAQTVCRQTMEMRRHLGNRMSDWTPTATRQSGIRFSDPELWPPSSTRFSKWRNSACDSLDVLHWSANSKIAQSKGFEHSTVLHLHLARLIILTPHEDIRRFAESYLSFPSNPMVFDQYSNPAAYTVLQWAIRDQYKARLTLIHAGAIFWYIRRYSCDSFIEPFATYLSTLVVWAYSIITRLAANHEVQLPPQEQEPQTATTSESESELDLEFINIDRPCDDESVQMFVKHGHRLTANTVRVGNICAEGAPRKILLEGIRLLSGRKAGIDENGEGDVYTWRSTKGYVASLEALVKVIK